MVHIIKEFNTDYLYQHRTQNMKNGKEERKIHLKDCFTKYEMDEIMDLKKSLFALEQKE